VIHRGIDLHPLAAIGTLAPLFGAVDRVRILLIVGPILTLAGFLAVR